MLNCFDRIAVQTLVEKQRYIELGAKEEKLKVTGSIKFDMKLPTDLATQSAVLKTLMGCNRPVWIAASTHEGEEVLLLDVFNVLLKNIPNLLFILVPRHPERFDAVYNLVISKGFKTVRRSQNLVCDHETQVFLGDSMGELIAYYDISDVVFVGGSLVSVGGHNLLEPAMLKKPIITGPFMHNFVEITRMLLSANALVQIQETERLVEEIAVLFSDHIKSHQLGENALKVVECNRGSLDQHLQFIQVLLLS